MTPPPPRQPRPTPTPPAALQQVRRAMDLHRAGQTDDAVALLRAAVQRHPGVLAAHDTLAKLLILQGRADEALYAAKRCQSLAPDAPEVHLLLAHAHAAAAHHDAAIPCFERALALASPPNPAKPALAAEAHAGLGRALSALARPAAAAEHLRRAIALDPRRQDARVNLGLACLDAADPRAAVDALRAAAAAAPADPLTLDLLALALNYDDRATPEDLAAAHRSFGRALEARVPPAPAPIADPDPHRPLRVGFLSRDLHQHSVSSFLLPLLAHLDRAAVAPILVSLSRRHDAVTDLLRAAADEFHDASSLSDAALDARLRELRLDAIVELSGHFTGHRLAVLARQPAPLQITWMAYANTTGLSRLSARFIDSISDPSPAADALATEPLLRLDPCFLCYRPPDDAPEPAAPSDSTFTFCSFNDLKKINPSVLDAWSLILARTPGSRLLLKSRNLDSPEIASSLRRAFEERSIPADRVELLGRLDDPRDHLALYRRAHLALDTFPYAGTTTTCEALWMGVPVLTIAGHHHAARVGASLLSAVALPELIATSPEDYADRAAALAADRTRLATLRSGLRQRVALSPLRDEPAFARRFAAALRTLWHQTLATPPAR